MVLKAQDAVGLRTTIRRLSNQQDGGLTGLVEIIVQDRRKALEYLYAFKTRANVINMGGGYGSGSIVVGKLVTKEKSHEYNTLEGVK